jgi:hypothetical protein
VVSLNSTTRHRGLENGLGSLPLLVRALVHCRCWFGLGSLLLLVAGFGSLPLLVAGLVHCRCWYRACSMADRWLIGG